MKFKIWGVCDPKLGVTLAQKIINLGWLWPKILHSDFKQGYNAENELKTIWRKDFEI